VHFGYSTVVQKIEERGRDVTDAVAWQQRTAEAFGLSRIERTRKRQAQLAATQGHWTAMRADHGRGLSD